MVGLISDSQKTKNFDFGENFAIILFAIKNNPNTHIFGIVDVGVDDFLQSIFQNFTVGQKLQFWEFLKNFVFNIISIN